MRLSDLHPKFLDSGGEGISRADGSPAPLRVGVGVEFDCPDGCGRPCFVPFSNPLDGGPALEKGWNRTGETPETLTLAPSIFRNPARGGCGWHGFIRHGEVVQA